MVHLRRLGCPRYNNDIDVGMRPAEGMDPPRLSLPLSSPDKDLPQQATTTTDDLQKILSTPLQLSPHPSTDAKLIGKCNRLLTPQQLNLIVIGM